MANKRKDPNYTQVSGTIPVGLSKQFRQVIAWKGLNVSKGLEQALEAFVEKYLSHNTQSLPNTITEFIQQNYYKLKQGELEKLDTIASGTVPTVDQVLQIAEILDLDSNELLELAKRTFPEGLPSNKLVN